MRRDDDRVEAIRRGDELQAQGWPSLAADVREGLCAEDALWRLRQIGEDESDAAQVIRGWAS